MSEECIKKLLKYIDEHINEKVKLKDLSNIVGYSPFYFSKLFSEIFGISVTTYIRIRKLQYAMMSLLEGEKIVDISFRYAFESHEAFTRSFTKLFGTTPKTVRKYLTSYTVPEFFVPNLSLKRRYMDMKEKDNIFEDMHQILFEFLNESVQEAKTGYCSEISITLLPNNQVRLIDNGRGIPLSDSAEQNQAKLDEILAGHPITSLEYGKMDDFYSVGLQTVNSLCEQLSVIIYRNDKVYKQDYVRGIAQHEINCNVNVEKTGMEICLIPDMDIFGDIKFSKQRIENWIAEKTKDIENLTVNIE